ncbi:MAG TPA: gamma-glutamyltransferase [Acidimicrobiales bacterium]|nr:gamma-glutamyltransferase [Acidimicrobiales bacterium]
MVSTSSPLAVAAGLWALDEGGSAVDAAVAADAVLGVTQPLWTGIGGDAFALVADGGEVVAFNGSGPAPAGLTLDRCLEERVTYETGGGHGYDFLGQIFSDFPPTLPDTSALSVTVPGVVDTWVQLVERFGRLPLATTLRPAIELARSGFPVGRTTARAWRADAKRLRPGAPFPPDVRSGDRCTNEALADSLAAVADGGRDAHYGGSWADEVVAAVQAEGGVLDHEDLLSHRGEWTEPVSGSFRGLTVDEAPPNGQGVAVLAALAILEDQPPWRDEDPASLARVMLAVRDGMRRAHAEVADPRTVEVPAFWAASETVYTAAVAGELAVSLISSTFHAFGSGLVAGGATLQNRGLGFSLDEGHPGVVAPGKRPFHTIIPAMVRGPESATRPWAAFGVVGGSMQPQGQVQVLTQLVDGGRDAQGALDAPRARWLGGDLVALEAGVTDDEVAALRAAGFTVADQRLRGEGAGCGQLVRCHADGWLEGAADQRRDGVAFGR